MNKRFLGFLGMVVASSLVMIHPVSAVDLNTAINSATSENTRAIVERGTLIEIGNTSSTTTVVVRVISGGTTQDKTLQITPSTELRGKSGKKSGLGDWIAGDQLLYTATLYTNSNELVARRVANLSMSDEFLAQNGFVTGIDTLNKTLTVDWSGRSYTLKTNTDTKMVSGKINPASIADYRIGDRIRARVIDDKDGNSSTWLARIIVVLRRGDELFVKVSRWVVPGRIVSISSTSVPATMQLQLSESPFFQAGDVNNTLGQPGTIITVDISSDTQLVRRYLGSSTLSEYTVGDNIKVMGRRDDATGHLVANVIKNESIQQMGVGYYKAKVTGIDSVNRTITVSHTIGDRDSATWVIKTNTGTKYFVREDTTPDFSDVKIGDELRVRGTAHMTTYTIDANMVAVVRD